MSEIDYNVRRSDRATKPRIDVNINEVKVIIPDGSDLNPDEIVEEKKEWIQEKKQKFDEYLEQAPERNFEEGEKFLFKGQERTLNFEQTDSVDVNGGKIVVPESEKHRAEELLEEFFREKAEEHIQPMLEEYREKMDVDYEGVAYRNQRTLWGSCSPKENLSFNWRLVMSPEEVMEYVVVHELAHLKERNHTKKFWRIVEEYHDSHKKCSNWLEENSPRLIFTREDL
jgi:predicted metal-dependent hydrolase